MKVTIMYGSATGNAEHIAKDLAASINNNDSLSNHEKNELPFNEAEVMELDQFKKKKLLERWSIPPSDAAKHALIVVCSTSGNGDAPENASRFVRFLKRAPPSTAPLRHVAFAMLGLGDTNYDKFCACAKQLDRQLANEEWGATRAVAIACADEALGLEDTVEPWLSGVLTQLARACHGESTQTQSSLPATSSVLADTVITDVGHHNSVVSPTPLFILYGSATGNSEQIAKDLAAAHMTKINQKQQQLHDGQFFQSVVCCELNDYKKKCLCYWENNDNNNNSNNNYDAGTKHGVIIVCSTTGNANAPENADRFLRWLKRQGMQSSATSPTSLPFRNCAFAVLGLGDSNYDVFCAIGKVIDKKLAELGGLRVLPLAEADEATGLEEVVESWTSTVVDKVSDVCKRFHSERRASLETDLHRTQTDLSLQTATILPTTLMEDKLLEEQHSKHSFMSSAVEEKKMEHDDSEVYGVGSYSTGVMIIRNLISILPSDPLPIVDNSKLPSLVSKLSSCELIHDDCTEHRPRLDSIADNMTTSSASSGFHYTMQKPYESTILNARYLTNTSTECAKTVCEIGIVEGLVEEDKLMEAMKIYDDYFPLTPPDSTYSEECFDDDKKHEKNGKRVIEMSLSLPDDFTLEYEPGDSVGVIVSNSLSSTNFVLSMLQRHHGILPSQRISVDANHPVTVREAVHNSIDLCSPIKKKSLFQLSMFATDPEEEKALRLLCSSGTASGEDLYLQFVEGNRRSTIDILNEFPSCQSITLEGLLGCLPSIPPRYYSVCSSPLAEGIAVTGQHSLKVAFSVVDYLTPSYPGDSNSCRRIRGLATRHLECLCSPFLCDSPASNSISPSIQIFPKPAHDFRLPPNLSTPLILIGPGTGIAPFLGFLSHRQAQYASLESTEAAEMASEGTWRGGYELDREELHITDSDTRGLNLAVDYMRNQRAGEIDLFFGCRYSDHDWLYQKEIENFKSMGILTNLYTAFSRERGTDDRKYVQNIMLTDKECGKRIMDMILEKGASVYICGDGNSMGKDVQEAIGHLLAAEFSQNDLSLGVEEAKDRAVQHINQMKSTGRLVLDIWS